jgi:hypothetical protein
LKVIIIEIEVVVKGQVVSGPGILREAGVNSLDQLQSGRLVVREKAGQCRWQTVVGFSAELE